MAEGHEAALSPILDANKLTEFCGARGKVTLEAYLPQLQEMTRYRLQSAGRAAEEQNWIAVIGSVAAMGDEAQKLGLVRWEVESRAIENLFKDGHIEEGKAALAGLQPFCLEAIDALREFLD